RTATAAKTSRSPRIARTAFGLLARRPPAARRGAGAIHERAKRGPVLHIVQAVSRSAVELGVGQRVPGDELARALVGRAKRAQQLQRVRQRGLANAIGV